MDINIYKSYSLDNLKFNNEVVWYRISFVGQEFDLKAKRLVLMFEKKYIVNDKFIDEGVFSAKKVYYTVSNSEFILPSGSYTSDSVEIDSKIAVSEFEYFVNKLYRDESSTYTIVMDIISMLNNKKIFI
jgi:hypothetical protein